MLEVKRKDDESAESMMKRFSRKVQQSGIVIRARKIRFFQREKSRNLQRRSAIRRAANRKVREEAKRLGLPYTGQTRGRR